MYSCKLNRLSSGLYKKRYRGWYLVSRDRNPDIWKLNLTFIGPCDLEINSSKTEEIRVNTTVKQGLRLNGEDIKRSSDFFIWVVL